MCSRFGRGGSDFFFCAVAAFGLWGAWRLLQGGPRRLRAANSAARRGGGEGGPNSTLETRAARTGRQPPRSAPGRVGQTSRGLVVGVTRKTASRLVQRRVKARCSAKVLSSRSGAPRGHRAHAVAFRRSAETLLPQHCLRTAPRSAGNRYSRRAPQQIFRRRLKRAAAPRETATARRRQQQTKFAAA